MKSKTLIAALTILTTIGCGTDAKDSQAPSEENQRSEVVPQKNEEKERVKPSSKPETKADRKNRVAMDRKTPKPENDSKTEDRANKDETVEIAAPEVPAETEMPSDTEVPVETDAPAETVEPSEPPAPEPEVAPEPLDPVSNLRCPEMYDNRVMWSSHAKEFFAAVGTPQNPVKSCQDGSNPYTTNKEALLPAEPGFYQVKVCAYDSSHPDRISSEKSISCSISF